MRAIDLFAGAGGTTTGATAAGLDVVWVANHNREAVDTHADNYPAATHRCQDLHQADWTQVPAHDVLLASPSCKGHSPASQPGRRRYHDRDRATSWAVVSCAEVHRPAVVIVENVSWFLKWELFDVWLLALERLGYGLTVQTHEAADSGVPQNRARVFIVGHHGKAAPTIERDTQAHVPAAAFINWKDPAGEWTRVSDNTPGVQSRVAAGRARYGRRFISQHVTGHKGRSLDRPIGTVTTKDQWRLVDGDLLRPLTTAEVTAAMGFPEGYLLPGYRTNALRLLGNAVPPPLATHVILQALKGVA